MFNFRTCLIGLTIIGFTLCELSVSVEATYGDPCTKDDTSNCTQPQEMCLSSLTCGCSPGFIEDVTEFNGTVCRLPKYNESCNATSGCQPDFQCLNTSGSWLCQCDQAVDYYNSTVNQCMNKPLYGEACDVTIGCEVFNECVGTPPTCQCNSSAVYFDSVMYQCMPMSDLKVNVLSTVASPTTVTITWEEQNPDMDVFYRMTWVPSGGHIDYLEETGGQVSGLLPATSYIFNVTSVLPADPYFPEKSVSATLPPIRTMALHDSTSDHQDLALGLGMGGVVVFIAVVAVAIVVYMRTKRSRIEEALLQSHCAMINDNGQKDDSSRQRPENQLHTESRDVSLNEQTHYGTI